MPHYIVESIEFDFSDSMGTIPEEEQKFITENVLGLWWVDAEERFLYEPVLDPEEALIEKITEKTGWCIKSIKFCENRPHPLTSYMSVSYTHLRAPRDISGSRMPSSA